MELQIEIARHTWGGNEKFELNNTKFWSLLQNRESSLPSFTWYCKLYKWNYWKVWNWFADNKNFTGHVVLRTTFIVQRMKGRFPVERKRFPLHWKQDLLLSEGSVLVSNLGVLLPGSPHEESQGPARICIVRNNPCRIQTGPLCLFQGKKKPAGSWESNGDRKDNCLVPVQHIQDMGQHFPLGILATILFRKNVFAWENCYMQI